MMSQGRYPEIKPRPDWEDVLHCLAQRFESFLPTEELGELLYDWPGEEIVQIGIVASAINRMTVQELMRRYPTAPTSPKEVLA